MNALTFAGRSWRVLPNSQIPEVALPNRLWILKPPASHLFEISSRWPVGVRLGRDFITVYNSVAVITIRVVLGRFHFLLSDCSCYRTFFTAGRGSSNHRPASTGFSRFSRKWDRRPTATGNEKSAAGTRFKSRHRHGRFDFPTFAIAFMIRAFCGEIGAAGVGAGSRSRPRSSRSIVRASASCFSSGKTRALDGSREI